MQHDYNDLLDKVRNKESEKNLTAQRLQYLTERKTGLDEFLQKAGGQLKGIDESIGFTQTQVTDEEKKLAELEATLEGLKATVEEKRTCVGATLTLTSAAGDSKNIIQWYDALTATTPVATGGTFTTPALPKSVIYYVESTDTSTKCTSVRKAIRITVIT